MTTSRSILSCLRYASNRNVADRLAPLAVSPASLRASLIASNSAPQSFSVFSRTLHFSRNAFNHSAASVPPHFRRSDAFSTHLSTFPAPAKRAYATQPLPSQTPQNRPSALPRYLYSRARRKRTVQFRSKTSLDDAKKSKASATPQKGQPTSSTETNKATKLGAAGATPREEFMKRLPNLQNRFHAPTKEELLAAATGFWSRLRVRFKWFSIRSLRPFNMDDLSAFFSAVLVGHVIWILVGTTTFFSLLILTVNTVFAQETLAGWVGSYLTKSSGVKVVFESAIVPRWKDGVITFKNVFVSRRPGQTKSKVSKGSQEAAAAAAAAELASERAVAEDEDTNYTQFDLSIEAVNVTLSFARWFNGKGLLRDVEINGVRGVVDRTAVEWNGDYVDPRIYRHEHYPGDFELESFKLDDLLVSVYQPGGFRPFSVSIFSADLPQLRKQWLCYDFLSANHVSGSFDESLFTIHPRQTHNYTGSQLNEGYGDEKSGHWKKHSRIRIDGLKIDHLNRGVEGPFSWIYEGNVDIVADIRFPADDDESIAKVMSDFYDRVEASVNSSRYLHPARHPPHTDRGVIRNDESRIHTTDEHEERNTAASPEESPRYLILDLQLSLRSVRAYVPLFTRDLSYVNLALVRPIVAYINSHSGPTASSAHQAYIPVSCRVVKPLGDFEGSWTIFDSGLMEDMSRETYEAFARGIEDEEKRGRRFRKVGWWTIQLAIQALFLGLAGNMA